MYTYALAKCSFNKIFLLIDLRLRTYSYLDITNMYYYAI